MISAIEVSEPALDLELTKIMCIPGFDAKNAIKKFVILLCWNGTKLRFMEFSQLVFFIVNIVHYSFVWWKQKKNMYWNTINKYNLSLELYTYRVSHSKEGKVILLWWGHRFWFFLVFWVLHVHEIDSFMPNSSVFIFLMFRGL